MEEAPRGQALGPHPQGPFRGAGIVLNAYPVSATHKALL